MPSVERRHGLCSCAALLLLLSAQAAVAQPGRPSWSSDPSPLPPHRADELVVRFRPNARASDRAGLRARVGGRVLRDLGFINAEHLRIRGIGVSDAIERLRKHPLVEYAEPSYEVKALAQPNDPQFPQMYSLRNTGQTGGTPGADIRATQAWDLFTGDPEVKVGVIDTGVDYNHPDLAANIWTNPGEIPGNGQDDDGNGYVDDVHGYDFANGDPDPYDDHGHGTHVSGTIAAVGNNGVGVVGVNWRAKIVGIKFLSAGGSGSTAGAIAAVGYAIAAGVRLTNNSWGGGPFSQGLLDAINAAGAAGQLFVAAAGNSSSDNDQYPAYPASYDSPYIVAVASTDHNDLLSSFSSYGATSVDLGAPGSEILSTLPGGTYGIFSGTSMASPHVAGALAFVLGRFPAMSGPQAKTQILTTVDPRPSLAGRVLSGGRLNLFAAVLEADETPPGAILDLAAANPGSNTMGLAWTATGDDGDSGRAVRYEIRYSVVPITEANFGSMPLAPGPTPQTAGSPESAEVLGLVFNTAYYFAIKAFDEFGQAGPISNLATGTTMGIPDVTWSPALFSQTLLSGAAATQSLTLRNDGQGTLDFTVPDAETPQPVHAYQALAKGEPDPRPGILGSGGPDASGYRWVDSDQPGGPAFEWVDISGVGQPVLISGDDQLSSPIAMGMIFPFYGGSFNTVYVCTNGFLTFSAGGAPYVNQPLPNPGAPPNLIAPFWDDLYFPGQDARTHFDGARFIVSWTGVYHLSGGGPYTFQVILYPSGEIRCQYLSMAPPTTSATVGIQDGAQSVGLTAAYDTSYVHDGLAVRFDRTPPWLSVSPPSGRVHAGQETQLTLSFDALGLAGGHYDALVRVLSNDPDESSVSVPVELQVIGAPDLAVSPNSLDFGTVFSGSVTTRTLTMSNPGSDPLVVSGITSGDPTVTATPASFTLAPSGVRLVDVTYAPGVPGPLNDALTIASNDPDAPARQVPLLGSAVPAPEVSVAPESLSATVVIPDSAFQTLTIHNTGGSPLAWSVAVQGAPAIPDSGAATGARPTAWGSDPRFAAPGTPGIAVDAGPLVELPVVIPDPVGDGGPVDIAALRGSGSGGHLQVQMDLATPLVPSNFGGFLSLDVDRDRFTGPPPSFGAPGQDIGVEYEVLFFNLASGTVQLYSSYGAFLGSFPATIGSQSLRFAIPLSYLGGDDGDMDVTGVIGTAYGPTDWFPDAGHGTILSASWLTASPLEGVVEAGQSAAVTVAYRTAGLLGGQYLARLEVTSNDPDEPRIDVPVRLTAIGAPNLAVSPAGLDFGSLFVGLSRDLPLLLINDGSETLEVGSGSVSGSDFLLVEGSFPMSLAPGDSAVLTIRFAPAAPCDPCAGHLTLHSNDPGENPLVVALTGAGLAPPVIAVSPASLEASLLTGQSATRTLRIDNAGGSPLVWSISARASLQSAEATPAIPSSWQVLGPVPLAAGVNRAGDAPHPQAVRATYGAAVPGRRILLYSDEYTAPSGYHTFDLALQSLGLPYTAYYYDAFGFGTALVSQPWDVVIVGHASYYEIGGWWSEIETFLNGGGKVLISTFDVDGSNSEPTTLWSTIGLGPRGDLTSPPPVHWWDAGHALFNRPQAVPQFLQMSDFYYDNGDFVGVAPGADDPAGFAPARTIGQGAIVVSADRRAIVNGFIVSENQADADSDGMFDAVELLINEIDFLAGAVEWLSSNPSEGTVPPGGSALVEILIDATGLLAGDYHADLLVSSNDPIEPESAVPTHLHVTGVPDIALERPPVVLESSVSYQGLGARTVHDLAVAIPPPAGGVFELVAEGLYSLATQTATLSAEGHTLGTVGGTGAGCAPAEGEFAVDAATLAAMAADGVVHAAVQNSAQVSSICSLNRHIVRLRYPLPADFIDFGSLFAGLCVQDSLRVFNRGTDSLRVTPIVSSHPAFTVSSSGFVLAPGESRTLAVTYCAPAVGLHEGVITLHTNDPDAPAVSVNVRGRGLEPPDIAVSPAQVVASLPIPATEIRTVTVRNTGGSALVLNIETASDSGASAYEATAAASGASDPPGVLGSGGPDRFGYRWWDSAEPGGPAFAWVDIARLENLVPINGQDTFSDPIPMGMNFPFYGTPFNAVRVCTNGFLTFSSCCPVPTNVRLPSLAAPPDVIAPFWDGLTFLGFSIYAHFDGSRFIVSWHGARHRGTPGGPYTFQVILYPNGLMVYQYLSMTPTISEATVGMQNAARNDGLTVVHNSSYVRNALAVVIAPPLPFLSVQPPSGVVPPGGSLDLRLELKTFGLVPGIYRDTVRISSNDPDESMVSVPVVLNAGSQPDIAAIPSEVAFGTVYVGQSGDRTLQVRNAGLGVLEFTGASVTGSGFSLASAVVPALLGPGESVPLAVRFAPASACAPCIGALELQSNDQDENPLTVPLSGTGLPPPDIAVSLDTLRAAGATTLGPLAQQRTKPLLVSNSGASDLRFSVPVSGDSSAALVPASPRWISADPASATIPAGSSMALDVVFNAADLPDGDHAGNLVISSNDPDEPAVEVPCRFHVGVVGATFELDPNSLMPRSQGRWVSTDLELGSGHDPHAIVLSTLRLQRAVPVATDGPISYHDDDQDGLPQARYKFDRASLHDLLAEGDQVPVEVIGEVENVTWFQGIDMVRSLPPDVPDPPAYAGVYSSGSRVTITWNDPPGSSTSGHDLWISFDDGATWGLVAASLTGSSYQWTVPNQVTDQGLLELVSWDARGARGSWLSRRFRIVAGTAAVGDRVPGEFGLRLAGTSPGRGSAGLELAIPTRSAVELRIFDVHGRFVSELAQREFDPGWHRLAWNGTVSSGAPAPAGVYFVRLIAGGRTFRVRIALLR